MNSLIKWIKPKYTDIKEHVCCVINFFYKYCFMYMSSLLIPGPWLVHSNELGKIPSIFYKTSTSSFTSCLNASNSHQLQIISEQMRRNVVKCIHKEVPLFRVGWNDPDLKAVLLFSLIMLVNGKLSSWNWPEVSAVSHFLFRAAGVFVQRVNAALVTTRLHTHCFKNNRSYICTKGIYVLTACFNWLRSVLFHLTTL